MIKSKLDINKFEIIDKTFSLKKANIIGALLVIPIFIVFFQIYLTIYPNGNSTPNLVYIFICLILRIILHEFVHGFVWHLYCQEKWKNIEFGFDKKTLSPYTNCTEILPITNL